LNPLILAGVDAADVVVRPCGAGQVAFFTARGPHKTTSNEDALLVWSDQESSVLAVADGVGGGRAGGAAALAALRELQAVLQEPSDERLRTRLLDAIEQANRAVLALGSGAATTLAAVIVVQNRMRTFHVGDSAVLVCGQRGRVKWQTVAHSPVGFAVEAGLLDEEDALHHDQRHVISNYVGSSTMRIEIGPRLQLRPRDTVLLASDGVFDNLRLEEILAQIRKGSLGPSLESLARMIRQRMTEPQQEHPSKPDDCTVILYRPLSPPHHEPSVAG
jgi:serine/threonine protein phosphatase PrpC